MPSNKLDGRVAFITGTSRGIGKALALHLADRGVKVVSTGKTVEPRDDLPGTIVETTEEIRERGGESIWRQIDVRDEESVEAAIEETVEEFGGLDFVVNNAGAIQMAPFEETPPKRFDLLNDVNVRGTYATTYAALPHLRESDHAHVLAFSPPVTDPSRPGMAAYAVSKYGMTVTMQSLAGELADDGVAANALWPVAAVESEATRHFGMGTEEDWRRPEVVCDAVEAVLRRDPAECTGNAFYDEAILREEGVEDFSRYNVVEDADPGPMSARLFDPDFERPA
ncbi:SDR family oxidoreductase [Halopelagius longus]|uniref:Citronellol/citronellal dehydrogenase n=1 Tax=Halopelagius longus TaxID=1236180 RepID=A0A1H1B620_9EURY|nr:SDR family oxidoreductase [Halopelagius longus]RDI70658.1 SDR family NAD(P)-dependent oxidoreductase [Halopelagius longus]SDQ47333.1 citronellol/citronellal dehydrogenase [Halopelagius longus]